MYVPLHLHTQFSLLDGLIKIDDLATHLSANNMDACAITDHGSMGGVLNFQKALTKKGIKPLLGVEAYITSDPDSTTEKTRDNYHLVLLAKNNQGLSKLFTLQSEAALRNHYYKPRIHLPKLECLAGDVVVVSACLKSILSKGLILQINDQKVIQGMEPSPETETLIQMLLAWFGEDLYLELQDWDDETHIQSEYNKLLIELASKYSLPLVITSDAHYLTSTDHTVHEFMMAMQLGTTLPLYQAGTTMKYGNHFWVKTPEEMETSATSLGVPEATQNTQDVAKKCDARLQTGTYRMPTYHQQTAPDYKEFLQWQMSQSIQAKPS